MYRLRLRSDKVENVIEVISNIEKLIELEVFVLVNDQRVLLEVIQRCISSGIAVEIVPQKSEEVGKSIKLTEEGVRPNVVSSSSRAVSATAKNIEASSDVLKRGKEERKSSGESSSEAEKGKGTVETKKESKPEKTLEERPEKKRTEVEATPETSSKDSKEKQSSKGTSLEQKIAKQIQEAEKELDFDELLKLRDEAFSRTLIE